jgi:hypothetical protein
MPPNQSKNKQEEDKASLTKDLVMDEEAISKLPMTFAARCVLCPAFPPSLWLLLLTRLVTRSRVRFSPTLRVFHVRRYKMGDILGKGAFSTVRLATSKVNNKKWAVKAVARKELPQVDEDALRYQPTYFYFYSYCWCTHVLLTVPWLCAGPRLPSCASCRTDTSCIARIFSRRAACTTWSSSTWTVRFGAAVWPCLRFVCW